MFVSIFVLACKMSVLLSGDAYITGCFSLLERMLEAIDLLKVKIMFSTNGPINP